MILLTLSTPSYTATEGRIVFFDPVSRCFRSLTGAGGRIKPSRPSEPLGRRNRQDRPGGYRIVHIRLHKPVPLGCLWLIPFALLHFAALDRDVSSGGSHSWAAVSVLDADMTMRLWEAGLLPFELLLPPTCFSMRLVSASWLVAFVHFVRGPGIIISDHLGGFTAKEGLFMFANKALEGIVLRTGTQQLKFAIVGREAHTCASPIGLPWALVTERPVALPPTNTASLPTTASCGRASRPLAISASNFSNSPKSG